MENNKYKKLPMGKVVGIDLGTTNSCVAVMEGGKPTVIANAEGFRTTPSVVAYTKNQDQLVGQIAKRQAVMNPENTFYSAKRFVGRRVDEVNEESKEVSYSVEKSGSSVKLKCPVLDKQFSPEEVSSQVLRKLADDAGKYLGDKEWLTGLPINAIKDVLLVIMIRIFVLKIAICSGTTPRLRVTIMTSMTDYGEYKI